MFVRLKVAILAAAVCAISSVAQADDVFQDCNGAAFVETITDDLPLPNWQCEELERRTFTVNGQTVHVRVLKDKKTKLELVQQYAAEVMAAAEQSYAVYDKLDPSLKYGNVSFVIMDPMIAWTTPLAGSAMGPLTGDCGVRVFTANIDNSPYAGGMPLVKLTTAHELFHCIQLSTYGSKWMMVGTDWWSEGMAELASHLVYPTPNRIKGVAKGFEKISAIRGLTQQSYETLVFFSWLYAKDPARVFAVMAAMPTDEGGEAGQRRQLLTQVSGEELQQFAMDWVDGKVPMPGGGMYTPPKIPSALGVENDTEMSMDSPPLAIQLDAVSIRKGEYMPLEFDGGSASVFQRKRDEENWDVLPDQVGPDDCKGSDERVFVRVPTGDDTTRVRIQFKKTKPCEECVNSDVRDRCLVGHWKMDNATLLTFLRMKNDADSKFEWVDGTLVLVYDANGDSHLVAEGLEISGTQKATPYPDSTVKLEMNGIDAGTWSAEGGQVTYCPKESGIDYKTTIEVPGVTKAERSVDGVMQTSIFSYQCGATDLNMTYSGPLELGADAPRWHFTKVK